MDGSIKNNLINIINYMMSEGSISFADSVKFGNDRISYNEFVSDKQIDHFLNTNDIISENHPMIVETDDRSETVGHLLKIIYQIKLLQQKN